MTVIRRFWPYSKKFSIYEKIFRILANSVGTVIEYDFEDLHNGLTFKALLSIAFCNLLTRFGKVYVFQVYLPRLQQNWHTPLIYLV